jgi:hypothetical protein
MSPDDKFYAIVGAVAVMLILLVLVHYLLKKLFGINMVTEFYAAQAEFVGFWYDRKEQREAAADRRRASVGHTAKRKN